MNLRKTVAVGFGTGMAGAAWLARRNQKDGRIYLPLPPGRVASALVTGASSGIGAEFARQLAAGGYRPILVARRRERLEALAAELKDRYGVAAEALPADLATDEGMQVVADRIRELDDLMVLVNNAGFNTVGSLVNVEPARQAEMIRLHALAPVQLTQAALPSMVTRGQGAIINVSSMMAFVRARGHVSYSASKAFLVAFAESLALELHGKGVQVQTLCPGFTRTEFFDTAEYAGRRRRMGPDFLWMSAGEVVSESLAALERNQVICIPGMRYKLMAAIVRTPILGSTLTRLVI